MNRAVLLTMLLATSLAMGHGNNPSVQHGNNPTWIGVNIAGAIFAVEEDVYAMLAALTDITEWNEVGAGGDDQGPAQDCAALAVLTCGEGRVCWVCYTSDGNQSCSFACQDEAGGCEPAPPCGPQLHFH